MPYYACNSCNFGEWEEFPPLEGFEYEEGYEYHVLLNVTYDGNNALQKYTYSYVRTMDEYLTDSKGLPE